MMRPTHTVNARTRLALAAVLLLAAAVYSPAQTTERRLLSLPPEVAGTAVVDPAERLQLAVANSLYPVTPGDVYALTYQRAGEPVVTEITVENDYTINMGLFGRLDVRNTTFTELRPRIIQTVDTALPRSLPAVSMSAVGVFRVRILGAIAQSRSVTAWGLSRLSDVVRDSLTAFSSIRSITIVSAAGVSTEYDLFRALDLGDESQDPLIRPGDTITIGRAERVVYVGGEVNQSGRIELAPDDSLADVLAYVRGTTAQADLSRVRVNRTEDGTVRTLLVDLTAHDGRFELADRDIVTVLPRVRERPVVYVEGLVTLPSVDPDAPPPVPPAEGYERIIVPIGVGETLYGVLDRVSAGISPRGDLAGAQLIRDGEPVALPSTMERLLYNYSPEYDVELRALDRIVIPADPRLLPDPEEDPLVEEPEPERFVLITGGVNAPGRHPYLPGMSAYAHIRLAGGFDRALTTSETYRVYDIEGNLKDDEAPIEPEDHIEVDVEPERFVLVTGGVNAPGRHPYLPGMGAHAHIRLAGGFSRELNVNERFRVYDVEGNLKPPDAPIEPEDHIEVLRNSFIYNFNRHFPILATSIGFIATLVATFALFAP